MNSHTHSAGPRQTVRRCLASWGTSLALHVSFLLIAATITWAIPRIPHTDALLSLGTGGPGGGGSGGGGGGGRSGATAGLGQPGGSMVEPDPPANSETESPVQMPPAPVPQTLKDAADLTRLGIDASDALAAAGTSTSADPTAAILRELSHGSGTGTGEGTGSGTGLGKGTGSGGGTGSGIGEGFGEGMFGGTSEGFGSYIGGLRTKGLDVVLVLDATDSMSPYIKQAKDRLQDIIDLITGLVPGARFGAVAFKDYGDEYGPEAVQSLPLTGKIETVRTFLNNISAGGGGDIPEPTHEALRAAADTKRMGWAPGRQDVIILVSDAPVHSSGRQAAFSLAAAFAKRTGGMVNVIDVGGSGETGPSRRDSVQPDLNHIAQDGKGSAFLLADADAFWRSLIVSVFGKRYEQDVNIIVDKYVHKK